MDGIEDLQVSVKYALLKVSELYSLSALKVTS